MTCTTSILNAVCLKTRHRGCSRQKQIFLLFGPLDSLEKITNNDLRGASNRLILTI